MGEIERVQPLISKYIVVVVAAVVVRNTPLSGSDASCVHLLKVVLHTKPTDAHVMDYQIVYFMVVRYEFRML